MTVLLDDDAAATLRAIAAALRSGQLSSPVTPIGIARVAPGSSHTLIEELVRLSVEGMQPAHLALLVEARAIAAETALNGAAELVWTGPEAAISHSRDTAVVVGERPQSKVWPSPVRSRAVCEVPAMR